jgi:eukaryotic-like serine/threonine-protein kinase
VTTPPDETWTEISRYLDEVLDLAPEGREIWLADLARRAPEIAARIRTYLSDLERLEQQQFLDKPAAALAAIATLAGERYGAYTLDRELGHGGTGTVWLAHRSDGQFEGQAAVKLLNPALVSHPSARRFAREASFLARLQHPNVAHLLDAGVEKERQPYLVLEYVRGEHIDRYCEAQRLDLRQRIGLFLGVLGAVAHAHSNLIIHRDLKPSNILVTPNGVVKLLDFGVATLLAPTDTDGAAVTRNAVHGLTPGYAAPEQLRSEPVTTATDIYSLGIVLFLLLTGRHPLKPEGKTPAELVQLTLDTEFPRPSDVAADPRNRRALRGDLDNIVLMALRRNPAERYATVDHFAQDLRAYLALEPVSARPRSLRYLAFMFIRRHRAAVAAAAAIVVILIGAVAVTTSEMFAAREERDRARYQSLRAEASSDFLTLLMQSDPSSGQPVRTFHDRLELGVQIIGEQYRDNPRFAARMLIDLGIGFRDNQETRRANEVFAEAYDLARRHDDFEAMASAQCSRAYAEAYADIREGALERIDEGELLLSRLTDPDADVRARCLVARGVMEQRRGNSRAGEQLLREAMTLLEAEGGTHRQTYLEALAELGALYQSRNQPKALLSTAKLLGSILDRNGRGASPARLVARQNEVAALYAMGEIDSAQKQQAVINERALQAASSGRDAFLINFATKLVRLARPDEALRDLDGVVQRARDSGNRTVLTQALLTTGTALVDLARRDEAETALNEVVSLTETGIGNKNARALAEAALARLDIVHGDLTAARQHRDSALADAGYHTRAPERGLARVLLSASQIAMAEANAGAAEKFAREALAISEPIARGPDTSADVGEALLRTAEARLSARTRPEPPPTDIKSMLERATRCLTNGLGAEHPLVSEARKLIDG